MNHSFHVIAVMITLTMSPLNLLLAEEATTAAANTTASTSTVITEDSAISDLADTDIDTKTSIAISLHPFSTMGFGAQLHYGVSNYMTLRVGYHTLPYTLSDYEYEDDDGNTFLADADVSIGNLFAGIDVYPFAESFKLTLGYVAMNSEISGSATPEGDTVTIDDRTYNTATEIESIDALATFPSGGIYAGFGWGNPTRNNQGWGFSTEFGVIFMTESPEIDITANCLPNALSCHVLETSLEEDEAFAQEDLDSLTFYPVANIGVSYQF